MVKVEEVTDSDTSTSGAVSNEEKAIRKFVTAMVKGSLFVGTFTEKRFVQQLNDYRHVVKISEDESDVIEGLKVAVRRMTKFYPSKKWIGFTDNKCIGAPAGYNIWTTLGEERFGTYWLKVRKVHFSPKEVQFRLKVIRPYLPKCVSQGVKDTSINSSNSSDGFDTSNYDILQSFSDMIISKLIYLFSEILTLRNCSSTCVFLAILLASLATGGWELIKYLLEYMLKFMSEFQGIVKALTPWFLGIMHFLTKAIGGLYLMITVMWRDRHGRQPTQVVGFYNSHQRALPGIGNDAFNNGQSPYNNFNRRPYGAAESGIRMDPIY